MLVFQSVFSGIGSVESRSYFLRPPGGIWNELVASGSFRVYVVTTADMGSESGGQDWLFWPATVRSARSSRESRVFPRRAARRSIPAAALGLK